MNIHRAGMIPYVIDDDGEILMYFMKPSDPKFGGPDWQIAKGRIEDGLSELETALKEAQEELGLKPENCIGQPIFIGHFMKGIAIFAVEVKSMSDFDTPHFETGSTAWLSIKQFAETGRDINKVAVFSTHRKINKPLKLQKGKTK